MFRGYIYRLIMKIAHRFNWHYAPPIYPEGDIQLWCKWCGFRQTMKLLPCKLCKEVPEIIRLVIPKYPDFLKDIMADEQIYSIKEHNCKARIKITISYKTKRTVAKHWNKLMKK